MRIHVMSSELNVNLDSCSTDQSLHVMAHIRIYIAFSTRQTRCQTTQDPSRDANVLMSILESLHNSLFGCF